MDCNSKISELHEKDYYTLLKENAKLKNKNSKLLRELFGAKSKIKNLEEKLYKRNNSYHGEVYDKDSRKRGNR